MHKKKKMALRSLALFFLSYLLIFEVAVRLALEPTEGSYGALFGYELPPFDLPRQTEPPETRDRSEGFEDLSVDGKKITVGDLLGYYRGDPLFGYVPKENTTSLNGWWQSNNIGAMARYEITEIKQKSTSRLLVFGESFASGSRIPQEMAWPNIMDSTNDDLEVVNFAVDGYGMAQSYLRYRQFKDRLEYDAVLLMFAPGEDLWRDINIRRDLRGWELYWLMPRFILQGDDLKLVDISIESDSNVVGTNPNQSDKELRTLLRQYDRFYLGAKFEEPWLIGKSIFYKLVTRVIYEYQTDKLSNNLLALDSEALKVSQKIFESMNNEVKLGGSAFFLIVLPSHNDLKLLEQDPAYRNKWEMMVSATCDLVTCIDLSEDLRRLTPDQLDTGFDGTHYGPKANQKIAALVLKRLEAAGIMTP